MTLAFAHRGAPARRQRENTLPAFRHALESGVRALESDVWLTADDVPVLVHDAVFPPGELGAVASGADLRADLRALTLAGLDLLGRPAARAALPGLLAETAADGALGAQVLLSAAGDTWAWLEQRLEAGVASGEVRAEVRAETAFELVAGTAFIAAATRPSGCVDDDWIDEVVYLIVRGIAP